MHRRVLITQSNYLPWRGYFALFRSVDVVILFDTAQFTKRDWRNRNRIPWLDSERWLTVPVATKGRYNQAISDVEVVDGGWTSVHFNLLRSAYRRNGTWSELEDDLRLLFEQASNLQRLTEINQLTLEWFCRALDIQTVVLRSEGLDPMWMSASERLAHMCVAVGADIYVTAPRARQYLDSAPFQARDVRVEFADYNALPVDRQGRCKSGGEFSIVDLLMRLGPKGASDFAQFSQERSSN